MRCEREVRDDSDLSKLKIMELHFTEMGEIDLLITTSVIFIWEKVGKITKNNFLIF